MAAVPIGVPGPKMAAAPSRQPKKGEDFYHYDVGNQLNIQLKPLQANEAGRYGQHGSGTKPGQLPQ